MQMIPIPICVVQQHMPQRQEKIVLFVAKRMFVSGKVAIIIVFLVITLTQTQPRKKNVICAITDIGGVIITALIAIR